MSLFSHTLQFLQIPLWILVNYYRNPFYLFQQHYLHIFLLIIFQMRENNTNYLNSDIQLMVCIQRSIPQPNQFIKRKITNQCNTIFKRYQSDLSYEHEQLGNDFLQLYNRISHYSQSVQNLLFQYRPCQKLGFIMKYINEILRKIFIFFQTHLKQKKNYSQQKIKQLQQKLYEQVPGHCNRCRKFILSRNVEQIKVLIGAGQFNDPFDMYEVGPSDYCLTKNKQQDQQYKLKYAQVWENKKKIQQKFHMMQIQYDKRAYGYSYSTNQITKIQQIIKDIANQIKSYEKPKIQTQNQFQNNLNSLILKIYKKIQQYRDPEYFINQAVQVGEGCFSSKQQQLKAANQKLTKKNKDLIKKLLSRQKQVEQISTKLAQLEQENSKNIVQATSNEKAVKNLIAQHVEDEGRIYNIEQQNKNLQFKINQLQNSNQQLKNQINKLANLIQSKKLVKKGLNSKLQSHKSIKQKSQINDQIKQKKYDHSFIFESDQQTSHRQGQNKRVSLMRNSQKRSNSQIQSISKQKDKQKIKNKISNKQKDKDRGQQKTNYIEKIRQKTRKENKQSLENSKISFSRKNIKKLTQIRQQSSISIGREENRAKQQQFVSTMSIRIKQDTKISSQYDEKPAMSVKKIKNVLKSLRRIKIKQTVKEEKKQNQIQNENTQKIYNNENQQKQQTQLQKYNNEQLVYEQNKDVQNHQSKNNILPLKKGKNKKQQKQNVKQGRKQQNLLKNHENSKKHFSVHQVMTKKPISKQLIRKSTKIQNLATRDFQNNYPNTSNNSPNKNTKQNRLTSIYSQSKLKQHHQNKKLIKQLKQNLYTFPKISNNQCQSSHVNYLDAYKFLYQFYRKSEKIQKQLKNQINNLNLSLYQFQQKIEQFIKYTLLGWKPSQNQLDHKCMPFKHRSYNPSLSNHSFYKISRNCDVKKRSHNVNIYRSDPQQNSEYFAKNDNNQLSIKSNTSMHHHKDKSKYNQMVSQIKGRVSKFYLNQQQAYLVEKSQNMPEVQYNLEHSFGRSRMNKITHEQLDIQNSQNKKLLNTSLLSTFGPDSALFYPKTVANKFNKIINLKYREKKNKNENKLLLKSQISYLKVISILFVRLHCEDPAKYQILKKSIVHPYTYLYRKNQVIPNLPRQKYQMLRGNQFGRKTVGAYQYRSLQKGSESFCKYENNDIKKNQIKYYNNDILIQQALIKLIFMHRKCGIKSQFSMKYDGNQSYLIKNFTSNSFHHNETKPKGCNNMCKHLIQLQIYLEQQLLASKNNASIDNKQINAQGKNDQQQIQHKNKKQVKNQAIENRNTLKSKIKKENIQKLQSSCRNGSNELCPWN